MTNGETHLIGIGGVGMSALAQALIDAGHVVTGADRSLGDGTGARSPVLAALERQGVRLFPDDGSGITAATSRVVISTAVEDTNPGLVRARELGIPVVHRAVALAEVLKPYKLVAVVGTCGKSTVTAILGHLLAECGFDPVVVNGAQIVGWDEGGKRVGSTRKGKGQYAVVEVDESDKSLVAFNPFAVVITNASADHYSKEEMDEVFDAFVKEAKADKRPVVDGRLTHIKPTLDARLIPLPGEHNAMNAELAIRMFDHLRFWTYFVESLGFDKTQLHCGTEDCRRALKSFPGVDRRLQRVGTCGGAVVYDDYAHNPEKLRAMLTTLQGAYEKGVAVVWRPHGYAPIRKMLDALAQMFSATLRMCDLLLLPPVYDAGGTTDRSINSDALAEKLTGLPVVLVKDLEEAERILRERAASFGAMVTAGARDPGLPILAKRLTEKFTETT